MSIFTIQPCGGDGRDRTGGLHVANVALSQLSYTPTWPESVK